MKESGLNKTKESKYKVFVFDLDDTICELTFTLFKTAYALNFFVDEITPDFIDTMEYITFSDCGIMTKLDESKLLTLFEVFHVWTNLPIYNGVREFVHQIMSKGNIIYLTDRNEFLYSQTYTWLEKNKLPLPDLYNSNAGNLFKKISLLMKGVLTKSDYLKTIFEHYGENHIFYFENDPYYVQKASDIGIRNIFTFDRKYVRNKILPDNVRVLSNPLYNNAFQEAQQLIKI